MKIKDIEIHPISIPLREPFIISLGTTTSANNVIICIKTDGDLVGYGEAAPSSYVTGDIQESIISGLNFIKPILIGRDPFDISRIEEDIEGTLKGNYAMKAAIDMALLDLIGNTTKTPIYNLFGRYRTEFRTDCTIGVKDPKDMAEDAVRIVEQGFDTIKVKVGTDLAEDIERIKEIREAVGHEISIRADANQGWEPKDAVRAIKNLERYEIELIEQPVPWWDIRGLKWVRTHVDIPVMADESVHSPQDALKLIEQDAVDMFNIKLMKCGGIRNGIKIAHIAESAGMECMVGCRIESRVAITAASHLVASTKNITKVDLDSSLSLLEDPVQGGIEIDRGRIALPNRAGLGIESVRV
ncbi:MAG: dipeptide epimerase [Deltaproteobacteria bacterium]|nr:MAG: dipeptide epimerase [Deltaproteobacteria bacterium]